jgi:outer membrane protein assembly factor BamB
MKKKSVPWWPAIGVSGVAAIALAIIWSVPELPRQQRVLQTGAALAGAAIIVFTWFLFFSRLAWKNRLLGVGLIFMTVAVAVGLFRVRGVSGDLVPILEPRWKVPRSFSAAELGNAGMFTNDGPTIATAEFPQFYGPNRNAVLENLRLGTNWAVSPPKILWKQTVGSGWGGFAVKEKLAVTQEQRGEEETVACYELLTGKSLWLHSEVARYATTIAGEGPRATPTIVEDRVYTFGGTGILNCLDLRTGKVIWRKDAAQENEAEVPDWGYASSPLVVDGKVIVSVGGKNGSLVAYNAYDGRRVWAEGQGGADYSSPMEMTLAGVRQIVIFNAAGVSGHAIADGEVLWNHSWRVGHPHVTAPLVVSTNQILISSGYGTGCELVKLETTDGKWNVTREWKSMSLKSKFAPIFVKDDYIYGLDDGIFTCVDLKTGQRKWKDGRYGHGQGLLVGETILLTSEKGEVILIQPDSAKLVELARFQVFSDKTWNPPALSGDYLLMRSGDYLLMRNDKEAACVQLTSGSPTSRNVAVSFAK